MSEGYDFQEYTATVDSGDGEQESTVQAATVTAEQAGNDVNTRAGVQSVNEGDVLVQTEQPGVYDVLSADDWSGTGYASGGTTVAPGSGDDAGAQESPGTDKTTTTGGTPDSGPTGAEGTASDSGY